jgi:hypothetical protein
LKKGDVEAVPIFLFFYFFFAEDLQHESFSGSVSKYGRKDYDHPGQSDNPPKNSRNEKSKNDQ